MKQMIIGALFVSVALVTGGCTSEEPKNKKPETVRERAQAVGRMSDRIRTQNLEKHLVGVVDSAAEHAAELEKAAE
jgi:outer membrane murein-binding lipoprotein Lpp